MISKIICFLKFIDQMVGLSSSLTKAKLDRSKGYGCVDKPTTCLIIM